MFSDFYSFTKEEEDDDIDYTFSSSINDILYFVSFGINEYQKYLDDYPTLLQKGYSLAFQSKAYFQKRKKRDTLVFPTLYQIIEDFMKSDDYIRANIIH